MSASKRNIADDLDDPDEVPDLSTPEWEKIIDATPVTRGRPRQDVTKESTTIRLDPDVLAHFRSGGPGWQTRINEALRDWIAGRR